MEERTPSPISLNLIKYLPVLHKCVSLKHMQQVIIATSLCMCVQTHTYLLTVKLNNSKYKFEMTAFILEVMTISAQDNFKKVKETVFAQSNTNIQQQTQICQ